MLNCKQVATRASEYIECDGEKSLKWQMRLHLLMCSNCRRFMKHLRITQIVTQKILQKSPEKPETVEAIMAAIKAREADH